MPVARPPDLFIDIGPIWMPYRSLGAGPRVLLLHGLAALIESFSRHVDAPAGHFHGGLHRSRRLRTSKPRDFDYSAERLAQLVHDPFETRGIARALVALAGSASSRASRNIDGCASGHDGFSKRTGARRPEK
jgi:hypothetical protein